MNYCSECGSRVALQDRPGDRAPRYACPGCRKIFYLSPRLVVACLAIRERGVLLCRRGVQPGYGLWTLPCGFIEKGEPASRAAVREALEEAQATIELGRPYALFHIPHANQMQVVFLAELADSACAAGSETLEARLFEEAEIPWGELAFASTGVVLRQYFGDLRSGRLGFHFADIAQL
ncbi:MAG: NUDIX domain-containing protein [Betaproteobacteria bacterium]|nr:MAG: NUDIX domain-containing protein [Betaproteobacteria bacterium]